VLLDISGISWSWFKLEDGNFSSLSTFKNMSYKYDGGNYSLFRVSCAGVPFSINNCVITGYSHANLGELVFNFENRLEIMIDRVTLSNFIV
jgi:hypothetical protein